MGKLCKTCQPELNDEENPCKGCNQFRPGVLGVDIDCPSCNGKGCNKCNYGKFELTQCPHTLVDFETVDLIDYASLLEDGNGAPEPGGMLDQSHYFMSFFRRWKSDKNKIEADAHNGH